MIDINFVLKAYKNYIDIIKNNRANMEKRLLFSPQFDDTESEIVMLLILEFKIKNIIEFSPCGGWSTSIILDTLSYSDNTTLKSYDITDHCLKNVKVPHNVNWKFEKIDVRTKFDEFIHDNNIDYYFIDSDHSESFTKYYIRNLLNPLLSKVKNQKKQILISVHDVFHYSKTPSIEGKLVIEFLNNNNISYFTANSLTSNYKKIMKLKKELNIHKVIHKSWGKSKLEDQSNSCIFFILK